MSEDARTCVLLIKDPFQFTRSAHESWIMDQMFKPIVNFDDSGSSDGDCFEILELTTDPFESGPSAASFFASPSPPLAQTPRSGSMGVPGKERSKSLRITPQTRILTLAEKYRVVFLIDVSASMSVVGGTGRPKVSVNVAFET